MKMMHPILHKMKEEVCLKNIAKLKERPSNDLGSADKVSEQSEKSNGLFLLQEWAY
jgi:hypothetical protein